MAAHYAQGRYKAHIEKWGLGESTEKKTPGFYMVIIPQEYYDQATGEWVQAPGAYERRIDKWITENTIDYVLRDLVKLGYPHDTFDQLEPTHKNAHDFYGHVIEVQCKHEPWTNKQGQQVQVEKWDLAFDGNGTRVPEALDKKGTSKLNALFGRKLKDFRKNQRDLEPPTPPAKDGDDDEIPFEEPAAAGEVL